MAFKACSYSESYMSHVKISVRVDGDLTCSVQTSHRERRRLWGLQEKKKTFTDLLTERDRHTGGQHNWHVGTKAELREELSDRLGEKWETLAQHGIHVLCCQWTRPPWRFTWHDKWQERQAVAGKTPSFGQFYYLSDVDIVQYSRNIFICSHEGDSRAPYDLFHAKVKTKMLIWSEM